MHPITALGIFLFLLLITCQVYAGSDTAKSEDVPDIETIKRNGKSISFGTTEDKLWEAAIIVVMQKSTITHISKDTGLLVAQPYVLLVNNNDKMKIYSYFLDNIVYGVDVTVEDKQFIMDALLSQTTAQVESLKVTPTSGRWLYLY